MKVYTLPVGAIQTNCYIVPVGSTSAVVVDPGDQPEKIIELLEQLDVTPTIILLTHGHFDHIGGVKKLMETYPECSLYIGEDELDIVRWSDGYLQQMGHVGVSDFIAENATLLADGDEVVAEGTTFRTMHTPGHTKGGVIYISGDTIFSGDTVFREEIGRCDLPTGNYDTMLKTLKSISALPGDYKMYPGHEQKTTLEHERNHNPYFNQ